MLSLLDNKIGDRETSEWMVCLIDDHISNLERKMEDYTFQHLKILQHGFRRLYC